MDDKARPPTYRVRSPLYCPEHPSETQRAFLATEALEALFGGSIGGGKTSALLMAALQYVDIPGYKAIILRGTFTDLFLPGAIGDRFKCWMSDHNKKVGWDPERIGWNTPTYTAIFPSGARLVFGYLDGLEDHLRYKSCDFQFIGIDSAEEIRERDYRYMLSRLRRPTQGPASLIPLRMRLTATPASDGSSDWIRQRFVIERQENRVFVRSCLEDNPHIDQDAYLASLSCLRPVERHRLLHGYWFTSEERENMPITDKDVQQVAAYVEKNCFYVDISPYNTPHPRDLVGKDLFVVSYEQGESNQHPYRTQTYSRLKLIVREHE